MAKGYFIINKPHLDEDDNDPSASLWLAGLRRGFSKHARVRSPRARIRQCACAHVKLRTCRHFFDCVALSLARIFCTSFAVTTEARCPRREERERGNTNNDVNRVNLPEHINLRGTRGLVLQCVMCIQCPEAMKETRRKWVNLHSKVTCQGSLLRK